MRQLARISLPGLACIFLAHLRMAAAEEAKEAVAFRGEFRRESQERLVMGARRPGGMEGERRGTRVDGATGLFARELQQRTTCCSAIRRTSSDRRGRWN